MNSSPTTQSYFEEIKQKVKLAHDTASNARAKGYDPKTTVEVSLADNLAERVVRLIATLAPQITDSGLVKRIMELENEHGNLDWRVAITIAVELAQQKFCKFKNVKEAMEIGIRAGLAYITLGTVSSPLDGFVGLDIKKRVDGKGEYVSVNFAGPIRNAGGTAAAVVLLLADAVRKLFGYSDYDAQEIEIKRAYTEMIDYRERVAPRQYFPTQEEITFLMKHLPVEVAGEPSEKFEVSNYKDVPRIPTNHVRSGFCLMMTECIPLKAPKLWKQLSKWGKEFNLENWNFLQDYLEIQKRAKAQDTSGKQNMTKISPDYTYIHDLVAGRPIFSHPLRHGGFRLRYGRTRTTGMSACALHPATLAISSNYIATGTQLKLERPSKGAAITTCDRIDGPIVKLEDGSVLQVQSLKEAKNVLPKIKEILYLGDMLVPYGDFFNRAHPLVPAGYCAEWWVKELEKSIVNTFGSLDVEKAAELTEIDANRITELLKPASKLSATEALALTKLGVPLHPAYTYFWTALNHDSLKQLVEWVKQGSTTSAENGIKKIVLPPNEKAKRALELIGIPHKTVTDEQVILENDHAHAFHATIKNINEIPENTPVLQVLSESAGFVVRDKAGTFIGSRMGRPEKAKMRKLTGSPHTLFPIGEEGGKFRTFQSAISAGKVTAEFPLYKCNHCNTSTVLPVCEACDQKTQRNWHCRACGWIPKEKCEKHGETSPYRKQIIGINKYFTKMINKLGMKSWPELIKGVKGTTNKEHIPEHLAKGILRAKHEVHVNKDGTVRYDMTQLPITHFKPKEINTPISKLKQLGYDKDITGKPLINEDQVCELKPQDILLPNCDDSPDESAGAVMIRTASFIDDLLTNFYGLPPFYNARTPKDLIGHLFVCLAPHTSAGIIGRLIGFTNTQGLFAHPYLHAATRRDCDGDEACVILLLDAFLNFSQKYLPNTRGSTMDAPLVLTRTIIPAEVDDMVFDMDIAETYPLELYEAAKEYKMPWEVKIKQVRHVLNTPKQYESFGYTHELSDLNETVSCSAYKTLPSMEDKLKGQMLLAERIRAVDTSDVARLVIEKHFIRDTKGNLRKFSMQEFRCVDCNTKYRRPPLAGKCTNCGGKLLFTISEGSVVKYLKPALSLAHKYNVDKYLLQSIELVQLRIESVFGKEKEKQAGLKAWFG